MSREPLNLPTPVLFVISVTSIVLLLYISLYAISHATSRQKIVEDPYAEEAYNPGAVSTDFLAHPPQDEAIQERKLRNTAQSDFDRMNQETQEQMQRLKTERNLAKTQKSLQSF